MAHGRELALGAATIAIIGIVGLGALQADGRLIERTKSVTVPVNAGGARRVRVGDGALPERQAGGARGL